MASDQSTAAHRPVTKAVVTVAGLGTRFLPATKATPTEMLPVALSAARAGATVAGGGGGAVSPAATRNGPPTSRSTRDASA